MGDRLANAKGSGRNASGANAHSCENKRNGPTAGVAGASATGLDADERCGARRLGAGVQSTQHWDGLVFTPSAVVVSTRITPVKHYPCYHLAVSVAPPVQILAVRICPRPRAEL